MTLRYGDWLTGPGSDPLCDLDHGPAMLFPPQAEYQLQESYFNVLVKKEQMEEKMRGIREMKCRAVTCKKVVTLTGIASGCPGGG